MKGVCQATKWVVLTPDAAPAISACKHPAHDLPAEAPGDRYATMPAPPMRAEIVSVGSELLLGQIVDTNAAFIARQLAALGVDLFQKTTVGDNLGRVAAALETALGRAEVVITTGGLGPTEDDVTREAVARATGRDLEFHPELLHQIEAFLPGPWPPIVAFESEAGVHSSGCGPAPEPCRHRALLHRGGGRPYAGGASRSAA